MLTPAQGRYGMQGGFYSRVVTGITIEQLRSGSVFVPNLAGVAGNTITDQRWDIERAAADVNGLITALAATMPHATHAEHMERVRASWRETLETLRRPDVWGRALAVADKALERLTLSGEEINAVIEKASPFHAAQLLRRSVDRVIAVPPFWEQRFSELMLAGGISSTKPIQMPQVG